LEQHIVSVVYNTAVSTSIEPLQPRLNSRLKIYRQSPSIS